MGASWSGDTSWYAIDGQTLKATASDKVIYWNGASYGANQEAYFKLSTIDPDGVEMGLALKVAANGGAIYRAIEVFYSQVSIFARKCATTFRQHCASNFRP